MKENTILTGLSGIDNVLNGFRLGTLNVIFGRPWMGKTSLALNIAMNAAKNSGRTVAYYSLKEKNSTVAYRLVKSLPGTNSFSYESCRPDSLGSVNSLTNGLINLPIYVDDHVAFVPDYLQKRLDLFLADNIDVGLVIIDYLELIINRDLDDASKHKKRAEISNSLKLIAEKYNVAIVLLSTVWWSDDAEKSTPVPSCAVLKDSPVGQYSDSVIFIHRPVYYEIEDYVAQDKAIPQIQDVQLIVAKNGHGKSDVTINAKWDRSRLSYFETGTSEE